MLKPSRYGCRKCRSFYVILALFRRGERANEGKKTTMNKQEQQPSPRPELFSRGVLWRMSSSIMSVRGLKISRKVD
jgi:hypothetical protein